MKLLKLNVEYIGRYGGDINETVVFPEEVNGVLFSKLKPGFHRDVVSLGEVEGKHSECYGDLVVEVIDLNELDVKEVLDLVDLVSSDGLGYMEGYMEYKAIELDEHLEDLGEEAMEANERKLDKLKEKWNAGDSYFLPGAFATAGRRILKESAVPTKNLLIKEEDYKKAVALLKDNGIELI